MSGPTPIRTMSVEFGSYRWTLDDFSRVTDWYVLRCGDLFHLGFSSKSELLRALWYMPQLFGNPQNDVPAFAQMIWDWIEYDE